MQSREERWYQDVQRFVCALSRMQRYAPGHLLRFCVNETAVHTVIDILNNNLHDVGEGSSYSVVGRAPELLHREPASVVRTTLYDMWDQYISFSNIGTLCSDIIAKRTDVNPDPTPFRRYHVIGVEIYEAFRGISCRDEIWFNLGLVK